jgi:hypothetical protein
MLKTARFPSERAIRGFFAFLALTLFACVAEDLDRGTWRIHSGEFVPWRHFSDRIPLYPVGGLVAEWLLTIVSGILILRAKTRMTGVRLAAVVIAVSLTQRFANQRALLFLVLFYLAISTAKLRGEAFRMIRFQLVIVYLFSALNKIDSGFLTGESLAALPPIIRHSLLPGSWVERVLSPPFSVPLSWAVVALELAIPVALIERPKVGLAFLVILHLGFSLMMPGLWPFTLIMVAMGILYLDGL